MINVLHVIDTGGPGGAETVFLNVAAGLDRREFRSTCVVSRDGWLADALRARGIEPSLIPSSGSLNVGYLRALLSIVRERQIDVILAHLYGSAVYGSLAGLLTRRPVAAVLHGQTDIAGGGRLSGLKRVLVCRGTRRLVFVSERLKDELSGVLHVADAHCQVIPNGLDLERYSTQRDDSLRRELGLPAGTRLVGAVGNVRAPKDYDVFLQAARLLRDRDPTYRFVIAGEGNGPLFERLLTLRRDLGLEDAVTFLGLRADVPTVLRNLDVYALSSSTEGFSIACIEAMACGIPVVATRSGGPQEIIEDGVSGLLVPTRDPQRLAEAIERIGREPGLATRLARNGAAHVRHKYALVSTLRAYEALLRDLARTPRHLHGTARTEQANE